MKIIEVKGISKSFKNKVVIKDVNIDFESGKCYIITGDNGCGKSTLVKVILGLYKKTKGSYKINNLCIGYIPEKISFPEYTSIYDFLFNLGKIRGMHKQKIDYVIRLLLKNWEIEKYINYRFNQLSKGTIQKVLIIQAILHSPNIYVFDEPLTGLDIVMKEKLISLIEYLKFVQKTVIIISHFSEMFKKVIDYKYEVKDSMIKQAL